MPLVTVIIPNYNHETFLKQRIDSVLNQTFQDFEIIIFDDKSTDNSVSVLNNYKNNGKVSHFIINDKNSGSPFKQWKKGLDLAKGKYIWIAETDDFANQDFLKHTVFVLEKNKTASLCYTDSVIVDEHGVVDGLWSSNKNDFFKTKKWIKSYTNNGLDEILDFLLYKVTVNNISAVLFNKFFFKKLDFKRLEKFKNAGDLFTYISLCFHGDICYVSEPLNYYREHSDNFTKKNTTNGSIYKERLECIDFVLESLNKKDLLIKEKKRIKRGLNYFINKNVFNVLEFNYNSELNNFLIKCRRLDLINILQYNIFMIASRTYFFKILKFKGMSRKIIKNIF